MSRSDGNFPSYIRLDVDPNKPKRGWDDGCRRCSRCGVSWPNVAIFSPSPCCNMMAGIVKSENIKPDMSWGQAVKALLRSRFDRYYEKWDEGISDAELYWTDTKRPVPDDEIEEGMLEIENLLTNVENNSNAR